MKILVVDDSTLERKLLIALLKKSGIQGDILQAENGETALQMLGENYQDICLILLDWQMPVMNGLEFMEGVVKVPAVSNIPIVLVTASGSDESRRQAKEVNPNLAGYVVKPYKSDILLETIKPFIK